MTRLLPLPILLPLVGGALCLALWRSARAQRVIAIVTSGLLLGVALVLLGGVHRAGPLVTQVGGWSSPFGIALRADAFSAAMVVIAGLMGVVVTVYGLRDLDARQQRQGAFPLMLFMLMGVSGAFLTGDLFNLFVWFEVMLIASFVLLALGGERQQLRSAVTYVSLNLVSSSLFLVGVGLLYHGTSTLDLVQMGVHVAELYQSEPAIVLAAHAVLATSFGIKAAVFPLFFWLPASYHTPSPSVSALFAALLTKVGVYALIRVTIVVFPVVPAAYAGLGVIAALTMVSGVLGALAQNNVRRILSFHIVSQIGYMVAGLALVGAADPATRRLALAAAIFYVIHHILVKANLFLVAGMIKHTCGTEDLARLGGLARAQPWLAGLFLIPALSLAGVPPLSGFWAKLAIIDAGLGAGQHLLVAAAVAAGLLTLMSMMKIWTQAFWGAPDEPSARSVSRARPPWTMLGPSVALAVLTLGIGLYPAALLELSFQAAEQMLGGGVILGQALPGGAP